MLIKNLFTRFVRWLGYDLGISPNQVTWGRLVIFIPGWLLWVYKNELGQWSGLTWQLIGAVAIFIVTVVIIFDVVDGALARETGQVSDQGKVLDPLVDKFITYSSLGLFWGAIDHIGLGILFLLDISSTFLRGSQVVGANQFGKKKALSQNISKFFFATAILLPLPELNYVGNFLVWLAVCLATISVGIRVLPGRVKKSIMVLIPQLLTLCNLAAGIGVIWCSLHGMLGLGVTLNLAAMAFDLADGAAARKLGVTSNFGKYFDTVADLISFGAGPAFLVAALNNFSATSMVFGALYFLATCVRLYDYGHSKGITPDGFFRGLPSPAAAWLAVSGVVVGQPMVSLLVLVISAILMCSFFINWIHFSRALSNLTIGEVLPAIVIGISGAMFFSTGSFIAGPIVVYLFTPIWRKPGAH